MTYLETLKIEAAKSVETLAANATKRARELDRLRRQVATERGNVEKIGEHLTQFKGQAGARAADGQNAFVSFKTRLKRLMADLAATQEAVGLFERELIPAAERDLEEARGELTKALTALCLAARPAAEKAMVSLLDAVVAEHDVFLAACERLHQDYGLAFVPPPRYTGPRVESARLDHIGKHRLTSPAPYLAFTLPPAPQSSPPINPADKTPLEPTPTPREAPTATEDAPLAPEAPPVASALEEPAPDADTLPPKRRYLLDGEPAQQSAPPEAQVDAQDAPGDTPTPPLTKASRPGAAGAPDTLPACPVADALDALDLEALDCAAVDAEEGADLDEEPTIAEKENPGIRLT